MEIGDNPASLDSGRAEGRGAEGPGVLYLSDQLAEGSLPLGLALDWAVDVASALCELHWSGRYHGAVAADSVMLGPGGATLLSPRELAGEAGQGRDVAAFGALLHEMITGRKPGGGAESPRAVPRQGRAGLRRSASHLALRCVEACDGSRPNMPQVLTELRLFRVLARQWDAESAAAPRGQQAQPRAAAECDPEFDPAATMYAPGGFLPAPDPAPALPSPSGSRCPRCGGFVHFSRARTLFEGLLDVLGIRLLRCLRCHYRYGFILGMMFSKD